MISPWTPAGTKVVKWKLHSEVLGPSEPVDLNEVMTIAEIGADPWFTKSGGFFAYVEEHPDALIGLNLLRLADLPDSITSALTSQPLLIEETA